MPAEPTEADLREAALRHLARYATTAAGLVRVLDRRVGRWARATEAAPERVAAARAVARAVVERLTEAGAVDDAAFARTRARRLTREGRSRISVAAHLAARGVSGAMMREALPDDPERDLAAAVAACRRRRIGPFANSDAPDPAAARRALGILARAGFPEALARRALGLDLATGEAMLARLRGD